MPLDSVPHVRSALGWSRRQTIVVDLVQLSPTVPARGAACHEGENGVRSRRGALLSQEF
jgi:hypothetical protein